MKQALLVAGFDYEFNGVSFVDLCKNRMARLIASLPKDGLVFILFDVGAGAISKCEVKDPKKPDSMKNRKWTTLASFNAVTSANYPGRVAGQENPFTTSPGGVMSITDVYAYAAAVGSGADSGSVLELSFFSHGWMGGPVLVNTFDGLPPMSLARDPTDKDARPAKDFVPPNMTAAALTNLSKAFSLSGLIWTWGCAFARAFNLILAEIFKSPVYKTTPVGKLADADTFSLEFSEDSSKPDGAQQFDAIASRILPGGVTTGAPGARSYKIDVTVATVKAQFRSFLNTSYSAVIASKTHVKTIGALLGTYADFEKGAPPRYPLMLIPRKSPPYGSDFSKTIQFYKAYLGFAIDPEDRGYGVFVGT